MHRTDHSRFRKTHDFVPDFSHAERRTRIVIGVTAAMMVLEIAVGLMSHSMALLADGWHMSTHVLAFLITAVAYYFARTQAGNARFSFGTGKVGVLGGFTSAIVLSIVALLMAAESVRRSTMPEREFSDFYDGYVNRPLLHWSKERVFEFLSDRGVPPNPLYGLGYGRVGCFPCIHANKTELSLLPDWAWDKLAA